MPKVVITSEEIAQLIQQGVTKTNAAKHFGVAMNTFNRYLKSAGLFYPPAKRGGMQRYCF